MAQISGVCDFCNDPNPIKHIRVPVFDGADFAALFSNTSPTAWAACKTCHAMFMATDKDGLLQRAIEAARGTANFAVQPIIDLHYEFWRTINSVAEAGGIASALIDFIDGKINKKGYTARAASREERILSVRQLTGLDDKEFLRMMKGDLYYGKIVQKLVDWHKKFGTNYDALQFNLPQNPLLKSHVPHWQTALEKKFELLKFLTKITSSDAKNRPHGDYADVFISYQYDVQVLKLAEVYSFNLETITAITESGKRLPHDSPLTSVDIPGNGQGWFWFEKPLPIQTNKYSDTVSGLLWGLIGTAEAKNLAVRFTAFACVQSDNQIWPSTEWHWPVHYSFHDMITYSRIRHDEMYGPGGKYEKVDKFDTEGTLRAIAELSQFFLMSCVWFKQEIILKEPTNVERAARRRIQHENKLSEPPTVRVIALRKSHRDVEMKDSSKEQTESEKTRVYSCRWRVIGHPRLQPCGPQNKERKLIWISEYEAGPPDKPLREKQRVYAVVR